MIEINCALKELLLLCWVLPCSRIIACSQLSRSYLRINARSGGSLLSKCLSTYSIFLKIRCASRACFSSPHSSSVVRLRHSRVNFCWALVYGMGSRVSIKWTAKLSARSLPLRERLLSTSRIRCSRKISREKGSKLPNARVSMD